MNRSPGPDAATGAPARLLIGRRAVVTGAVGAIGQAIAARLAAHGASVVVADLDGAACNRVAAVIADRYAVPCHGAPVDVTDRSSVAACAERTAETIGECDLLVVNAGILVLKPILNLTERDWQRVVDVNLTGAFHTATVFATRMVATGTHGGIIFTSSLFGVRGGRGNGAYSAAKFGVIGLAQSMAADLAEHGIRVNAVCPGQVDSPMITDVLARRAEEHGTDVDVERAAFTGRIPLGRLGGTDEIADTYVYLASGLSSYVTGQHLIVDGGWQVG
jgi:NAD(P)-dependent dehydrogenase (short-subunit alcohol dehydrogenase family)